MELPGTRGVRYIRVFMREHPDYVEYSGYVECTEYTEYATGMQITQSTGASTGAHEVCGMARSYVAYAEYAAVHGLSRSTWD